MASRDPFGDILRRTGVLGADTEGGIQEDQGVDRPRTFGDILAEVNARPVQDFQEVNDLRPGVGSFFGQGVSEGLSYPFQILGIGGEEEEEQEFRPENLGEQVGQGLGVLSGMVLGYLPFSFGTRVALKGAGLARFLPRDAFHVAAEGIAFGLYEIGAGEGLEGAQQRFLRGAALGAAGEAALLPVIRAWRGSKGVVEGRTGLNALGSEDELIDPIYLKLEEALRVTPDESLETVSSKILNVAESDGQVDALLVDMLALSIPQRGALLPRLSDPDRLISAANKKYKGLDFVKRRREDGFHDVLAVLSDSRLMEFSSGKTLAYGDRATTLTPDEVTEILRADIPGQAIDTPNVQVVDSMEEFYRSYVEASRGQLETLRPGLDLDDPVVLAELQKDVQEQFMASSLKENFGGLVRIPNEIFNDPTSLWILRNKLGSDRAFLETAAHEYAHLATGTLRPGNQRGAIWDMFEISNDRIFEELAPDFITDGAPVLNKGYSELVSGSLGKELADATIEALVMGGMPRSAATAQFSKRLGYFGQHTELMSRLIELMVVDPAAAIKAAPRMTRMTQRWINREAPKIRMMMEGTRVGRLNDVLSRRWIQQGDVISEFQFVPLKIGKKQRQQFIREGAISGFTVRTQDGRVWEWAGLRGKNGKARLRDPKSGKVVEVDPSSVVRPVFAQAISRNKEVQRGIERVLERGSGFLGFNVADKSTGGFRRGVIDRLNDPKIAKAKGYGEFLRRNRDLMRGPGGRLRTSEFISAKGMAMKLLEEQGLDGLLLQGDDGVVKMLFKDSESAGRHVRWGETFSERYGLGADRVVRDMEGMPLEIEFSAENVMQSVLREAQVPEEFLDYYKDQFSQVVRRKLEGLVDEATLVAVRTSEGSLPPAALVRTVDDLAASVDLRVERTTNGAFSISTPDGMIQAVKNTEDEARSWLRDFGGPDAARIDMDAPISTEAVGSVAGTAYPPRPQQQMAEKASLTDLFATTFTAVTPMKRVFEAFEGLGVGPMFSKVFEPAQRAMHRIGLQMQTVKRPALGGKSFAQSLKGIERKLKGVSPERREHIVRYIEAMSREEIEAGATLLRGMTATEMSIARQLDALGMQNRGAELLAIDRMATTFEDNWEVFFTEYLPNMEKAGLNVSRTHRELIERFKSLPEDLREVRSKEAVLEMAGFSDLEIQAAGLVGEWKGKTKDDFAIFNVIRWLDSESLPEGFSTAREAFASKIKMNGLEKQIAREVEQVLEEGARVAGLDPKRVISGYFPHMRTTVRWGLDGTAHSEYFTGIGDISDHFIDMVRTGELEVYNLDPLTVASKYIRGILKKKEFGPELEGIKVAIDGIDAVDQRAGRLAREYIGELQGVPQEKFRVISSAIVDTMRRLGVEVNPRIAEKIVNTFTGLAYKAAIPFRPAIIARNWMQTLQMTPGRVGVRWYWDGVQKALDKGNYQYALKAGAIDPNIIPLHLADTVLGTSGDRAFLGDVGNKISQLKFRTGLDRAGQVYNDIFDVGLDWYRKPDDVGRAIAFWGQRDRALDAIGKWRRGEIKSFNKMMEEAKALTYHEPVQEEFVRILRSQGDEAAADFLGVELSKDTHFRYGHANHPIGWNGPMGRLFGQFGTYPVQYFDYLVKGLSRGTAKDRAEFIMTHAAVNGSIVGGGAAAGLNLMSWATMPALTYTGGPYADMALNLAMWASGSEMEKSLALYNMETAFPTFTNPQSIFLPGSYFVGDIVRAFENDKNNVFSLGAEAAGFRFLKEDSEHWFDFLTGRD